jgi:hypothetical protein
VSYLVVIMVGASGSFSPPAPSADITSNPLVDVVIGGIIAACASFVGIYFTNKQQLKRDKQVYQQQIEREQVAYRRSLKEAKCERLRTSYKVLLNAADKYQYEIQQFNHTPSAANIALTGVDEAVTEISLEDMNTDVLSIFYELRGAFHTHDARLHTPSEGTWEEVIKDAISICDSPALCVLPYPAFKTFWRKSGKALRPYIERLINLSLLIFPSTGPVLYGRIKAAWKADPSFSNP